MSAPRDRTTSKSQVQPLRSPVSKQIRLAGASGAGGEVSGMAQAASHPHPRCTRRQLQLASFLSFTEEEEKVPLVLGIKPFISNPAPRASVLSGAHTALWANSKKKVACGF